MFDTPGVYIREIPSGSRPIAGVATSNTAFVGSFSRGPSNTATRVTSFGEFERIFGGLSANSETSYAVRHYFLNGGTVAFIVRVVDDTAAPATGSIDDLDISASSEGDWGERIRIGVAHDNAGGTTSFTLLVREYDAGLANVVREEAFIDVSVTEGDARYVNDVVAQNSELISADLSATIADVTSLTRTTINSTEAVDLDALLEGAAADFTALTGGEDGAMEGDSDWDTNASGLILGSEADGEGIYALNAIVPEVFNLMCLPGAANFEDNSASAGIYQEAYTYCVRNFAFLLVDTPPDVVRGSATNSVQDWVGTLGSAAGPNSALYYPRVSGPDPLNPLSRRTTGASGMAAGLYARTDATRGVWKAPAGTEARIVGGNPIDVMTDRQQGPLNTSGINAIRTFPVYNSVIWGARTLDGADARASEWKYIPVRRLALFIEASLQRGLQWVVFEPNDEPLWASVRLNVGAFMNQLHRQGAFQGASARDAYLVKCDSETTTQADINLGILNVYVGFAPVRPAEFVVIRIQQRFANAA